MNRDVKIDIIKGLAIILMVAAHAGVPHSGMISMFHMAIFFLASGYCFKNSYSDSLKNVVRYIYIRIKKLYIPFVFWNLMFLFLRGYLIDIGIYTDNPAFLEGILGNGYGLTYKLSKHEFFASFKEIIFFQGEQQLEGASWFLRAMFSASIFQVLWDFILKKLFEKHIDLARMISAILFLYIGNQIGHQHIILRLNLHSVCSIYFLLILGMFLKKYRILDRDDTKTNAFALCITLLMLLDLEGIVSVNLNDSVFSSVGLFVIVSSLGWLFLGALSNFISKNNKLMIIFQYIGKNSMSILMLHFLCFKVVTLLEIKMYNYPSYALAAFPCLINAGWWSGLYTIIGVTLPLICVLIINKVRVCMFKNVQNLEEKYEGKFGKK